MSAESTSRGESGPSSNWSWLLPVLAFLLGALLAGVVVAVGTADEPPSIGAARSAASGEEGDGELLDEDVVDEDLVDGNLVEEDQDGGDLDVPEPSDVPRDVPDSCLQAAEQAQTAAGQADEVIGAVRDLDAGRLQELVDDIQRSQPEVGRLVGDCQATAGELLRREAGTPSPTESPAS